ncbi:MAG: hypothetical protein K1X29_05930 [Bdellovibrionales bacterium]|nr:hypothetical protein [Bdellovibrionales bacterium]
MEDLSTERPRSKTSLRLKYESEARVILDQLGGLEKIRTNLGLSQRKICQLLLVDPSAWSRWVKDATKVPPHVVKALQWYLELESKNPAWVRWREMTLGKDKAFSEDLSQWKRSIEQQLQQGPQWSKKAIVLLLILNTLVTSLLILFIKFI